ncbi:MAG: DUF4836 family protein [Bacteroidales bacterium]|nr:DUF4836 family protein [Bacteroidales bacterium]HOY39307.1 DUF4836 family protein [Bacteroidales bacterium]HQP04940.1 DUF4836 family protein [Bacteroidales bacterium]
MKKNIQIVLIALVGGALFLSSCTKKSDCLTNIPKGAFVVVSIDGNACHEMMDPNILLENEQFKEGMTQIEETSKKIADLINKSVKNPDETGIKLTEQVFGFGEAEKENLIIGIIAGVDKAKFEENMKMIATEMKFEFATKEKDGITYFMPEETMIMGWNKNKIMILTLAEGYDYDLEKKLFSLMNQKKDESILENKDFNIWLKGCKDFNVWATTNVIDQIFNAKDIAGYESSIGLDFNDNYLHIFFDAEKAEWTLVTKIRVNESIQNADWNKVLKNLENLGIMEDLMNSIWGGGYDDEYEDYDWESDTAYEALTEEEWAEIEELTKTN